MIALLIIIVLLRFKLQIGLCMLASGIFIWLVESAKISALVSGMNALDTKQEKLKAEQKACTAELNAKSKELSDIMADCKKRVKLAIKQELWKEFGISATR